MLIAPVVDAFKGDRLSGLHRRLAILPTPSAYVRALRADIDPSVLERRNRDQRTARKLLIRHYQFPLPSRDQHSVFTHRVRGQRVRTKRVHRTQRLHESRRAESR